MNIIDSNIAPTLAALYGELSDVNGDCRVTVLVSHQLNTLTVDLELPYMVRSLVERLRSRHHLSAAEVGLQDDVRQAQIGFATVSGDGPTARQQADDALRFIDAELLGRAEVIGEEIEELAL